MANEEKWAYEVKERRGKGPIKVEKKALDP
jgi:hypothetical protein